MSYEPLQDLDLDLEDDLAIASPARRTQRLGSRADGTAAAAGSPSPRPAAASAGTSREARAAAALARLAPAASSGDVKVDPDSGTLKQKCLVEKEREWQRFVERQLVGPNTYLQVRSSPGQRRCSVSALDLTWLPWTVLSEPTTRPRRSSRCVVPVRPILSSRSRPSACT